MHNPHPMLCTVLCKGKSSNIGWSRLLLSCRVFRVRWSVSRFIRNYHQSELSKEQKSKKFLVFSGLIALQIRKKENDAFSSTRFHRLFLKNIQPTSYHQNKIKKFKLLLSNSQSVSREMPRQFPSSRRNLFSRAYYLSFIKNNISCKNLSLLPYFCNLFVNSRQIASIFEVCSI